jgi:bacteriorhodopsin
VRVGPVMAGAGVAAGWLLLIGLLASSARMYAWFTIGAAAVAGVVAGLLARSGDRGVAVGVAISTGFGLAIAMSVVVQRWIVTGWPLW